MKKKSIAKTVGRGLGRFAVSVARTEANIPCPFLTYQPPKPEKVRKLRKF